MNSLITNKKFDVRSQFYLSEKMTSDQKFHLSYQEDTPRRSATVAGERKYDVYMGIDVFGRGTYGGGGWHVSLLILRNVLKCRVIS